MATKPPKKKKKKKKKPAPASAVGAVKRSSVAPEFQPYTHPKDTVDWRYMPEPTRTSRMFVRPPNTTKPVSWRPEDFFKEPSPKPPIIAYPQQPGSGDQGRLTHIRVLGSRILRLLRGVKK